MENKIILGLMGEKGSGKGAVSDYLIEKYGAVHYGTSKVLRRTLESVYVPITRENLIKLAMIIKKSFGSSIIIDSLIKDIEKNGSNVLIADGIRMHGDVEPFRQKFGDNFHLVYVTADVKTRYERTKKRKQNAGEDEATFEEFLAEEKAPTEAAITEIGQQADFTLDNNGTLEELEKQTEEMMKKIAG